MTLSLGEFTRRFALHILPKNFVKIRHYGFLSSTWKRNKLPALQAKLQAKPIQTKIKPKLRVRNLFGQVNRIIPKTFEPFSAFFC